MTTGELIDQIIANHGNPRNAIACRIEREPKESRALYIKRAAGMLIR